MYKLIHEWLNNVSFYVDMGFFLQTTCFYQSNNDMTLNVPSMKVKVFLEHYLW